MLKNKYSNYILLVFSSLLVASWLLYSFSFNQVYEEAKYFATEGAQPIVQILEILNYRGEELKPYFILFFTLTSLSFLLIIYLRLFTNKKKLKPYPLVLLSLILLIFIIINSMNKFTFFLLLLIGVSLLLMVSITLTVKHLYNNIDSYEDGDIIQVKGPFKTENEANIYAQSELTRLKKQIKIENLCLKSLVYLENPSSYYVDIYFEATSDNKENRWGEEK